MPDISSLLIDIAPFIAIGMAAQMIDGALGMAFGVITQTLLVSALGVPAATASAMVSKWAMSSLLVDERQVDGPLRWLIFSNSEFRMQQTSSADHRIAPPQETRP